MATDRETMGRLVLEASTGVHGEVAKKLALELSAALSSAPAAEPVVWLNPATLETIPHDSKRVFEACPAGSVAALKAGMFTEPLYAAPPPAEPAPQAVHGFPADEFQAACDAINDANGVPRRTVSTQPAPQAGAAVSIEEYGRLVARCIELGEKLVTKQTVVVAWMHDEPGRVDVIHHKVKELLEDQHAKGYSSPDYMHRPLGKVEHYTIPLYAHPTEQPSQDAALVAMAEAWELCAADLQEYEEDAAADAWRKAARDLRQHAARTAQAQGEKGGQA